MKIISAIIFFSFTCILPQGLISKHAGIGFRVDDNHSKEMFDSYSDVFRKYEFNFTFALNLSLLSFSQWDGLIEETQKLVNEGNELADHTPNHTTKFFTVSDTAAYSGKKGVDHIIKNSKTVCLKWGYIDTTGITPTLLILLLQ